ncbi:short chain dehydrogenase family protein [Lysobacter antibioticus]|uniref:SDR family NAD(P)-dependent oxidoreductase n=1 Tax=Lysobacter antibioticus TaxID=84531 RepID=UPI00071724A4|nr:SDR family oxidoreductase [Lysobacter antibioticus]ALN63787.1 short chain dehydrogenase family protein [Lysobacter antibioticus]
MVKFARRFDNRNVLITGGLGGIGLACAKRFAAEGANLALLDFRPDRDAEAAAACRAAGAAQAIALCCDVSAEDQVQAACARVRDSLGELDIVVNTAGLMLFKPLEAFDGEDWRRLLGVNLLGPVYFTREWLRHAAPGGAMVNIASVHASMTTPLVAPYAAAKAALLSLTRSAAIEGAAKGLRANAVLPGAIDTPMLWSNPNLESGAEVLSAQDIGTPDDVAGAVLFLASDEARFVTGTGLEVSGGRLARL